MKFDALRAALFVAMTGLYGVFVAAPLGVWLVADSAATGLAAMALGLSVAALVSSPVALLHRLIIGWW